MRQFGIEPDNINVDSVCQQLEDFDRPRMAAWVRYVFEHKVADTARERELVAEVARLEMELRLLQPQEVRSPGGRRAPPESDG